MKTVDEKIEQQKIEQKNVEQWKVEIITQTKEKDKWAPSFRGMWRDCFGDPKAYEDFYFSEVYADNIVYSIENKGMLHLNSYLWKIYNIEMPLHYIVGVATNPLTRRKGVMRTLLVSALVDMYRKKEPFTYLMPANVEYYKPFDFVSFFEKQEKFFEITENEKNDVTYLEYDRLVQDNSVYNIHDVFLQIQKLLLQQYEIYTVHNQRYFELLYEEKVCQNGNLVFCFEKENKDMLGYFAYCMDKNEIYIEQSLFDVKLNKADMERYVCQYFQTGTEEGIKREKWENEEKDFMGKKIHWIIQFPLMIRVAHLESFLRLFSFCFEEYAKEKKVIWIEDNILTENSGYFSFSMINDEINIEKKALKKSQIDSGGFKEMSVSELAEYVGERMTGCNKNIWFAEVV